MRIAQSDPVRVRAAKLAEKCNEGTLTPEELADYDACLWISSIMGILQAKARKFLKKRAK